MFWDITGQEITLLNQFSLLQPEGRQELQEYLRYTLFKQYCGELNTAILGNDALYNGFLQIARMCEREETTIEDVIVKIRQMKFIFYQQYEKVHVKYSSVLTELHIEHTLYDLGKMGFENILNAAHSNRKQLIKKEVEEFLEILRKMGNSKNRRRIMAV